MTSSSKQNRQKKKNPEKQEPSFLEEQVQHRFMKICNEQNKDHAQIMHKIQFHTSFKLILTLRTDLSCCQTKANKYKQKCKRQNSCIFLYLILQSSSTTFCQNNILNLYDPLLLVQVQRNPLIKTSFLMKKYAYWDKRITLQHITTYYNILQPNLILS